MERMESPSPRVGISLRWLGWAAAALVAATFLLLRRGEWRGIGEAVRDARPGFLVLAAVLQGAWLVLFAASFWSGLAAVGVRLPFRRTLPLSWACNFVNMVVKSGGMGGMALFIRAATSRGYAGSRTTLGYLLSLAVGYAVFLLVLAGALTALWLRNDLHRSELVASASTFLLILSAMVGLTVVVQSPRSMRWTYDRLAGVVNGAAALIRRRPPMDPDGGPRAAEEAEAVMRLVRAHPVRLAPAVLANAGKELAGVAVLYAVLLAFYGDATPALALIAYALTILFSYVSIIPSGLGIVEISLTALLIRTGVPPPAAALTTVVYRLFQFWAPFLVGAAATRFAGGSRESGIGSRE